MDRPRRHAGGFTLIELLAVIAILTLLLLMLTPTLKKSKELARRAICACNLKSLAAAIILYSTNNAGRIPLGYLGNSEFRQGNYMVNQSSAHLSRPDMFFGCLVNDKLVPNPRLYYCPSSQQPLFQFDTLVNPWLRISRPGELNWTRFGYGTRPLAGWDAGTGWVRYGWPDRRVRDLPRYEMLEGRLAMASDIVSTRDYVASHHDEGVNFASTGGSVHWFWTKKFNALWQGTAGYGFYVGEYAPGFYDPGVSGGVWFDMDRHLGG